MANPNLNSYPPLFRPTQEPDPKTDPTNNGNNLKMDPLPIIDMQCLDLHELDKACKDWGIFRLVNHGVPNQLLMGLQDHAKSIFNLPFESKQALTASSVSGCPIKYFWGTPALTPGGATLPRASPAQNMDWVEGLNVPLTQLSSFNHRLQTKDDDHHPLINTFTNLLEDYKGHLTRIASTLFETMLRSLKLELQSPRAYLDESTGIVRVYRYPYRNMTGDVKGMHVHTDSSIISILFEDEVGGFQFFKDEIWLDVEPIPNTLVVHLGDMMQALSDDEYKSVKHKVKLNNHKERVSICYFVFPEGNSLIHSSKYKPFTYNDFRAQVQRDVQTIGWKIGLESFKLPQLI